MVCDVGLGDIICHIIQCHKVPYSALGFMAVSSHGNYGSIKNSVDDAPINQDDWQDALSA